MRTTPSDITALSEGEIFVFGSNAAGLHGGGAARTAYENFGAEWGRGEGLYGQSYAIPTMDGPAAFQSAVERFLAFAASHPDLTFYLTKVGCGIAGYSENFVRIWFKNSPPNVIKPPKW